MSLFPIFSPSGVPDATISFTASAQTSTNATVHTFSSQSIGTAAANRTIVVAAGWYPNAVSSITVGGVTLSEVVAANDDSIQAVVYEGDITTGTSADIVVTVSGGGSNNMGIGVWALYGVGASDDNSTVIGVSGAESTDINISAGGVAIGHCLNHHPTPSASWTNMTERFDDEIEYTSHSGADTSSATATNPTVTCDWGTRDQGPLNLVAWPKG
jgi:hypothetical protein